MLDGIDVGGCSSEVLEFFGIEHEEAESMFYGPQCTPKQKAREIERLVEKHGYTYAD